MAPPARRHRWVYHHLKYSIDARVVLSIVQSTPLAANERLSDVADFVNEIIKLPVAKTNKK